VILENNMKKVSLIMALLFLGNGLAVIASILGWLG
jgi:hypothetical protein